MTKKFCDICGQETEKLESKIIHISSACSKNFDVCEYCDQELYLMKIQIELDFIKQSYWWKQNSNSNGEINYGDFRRVGTCEQGGMLCPKCGYCNNSYTFDGSCQNCGYTK